MYLQISFNFTNSKQHFAEGNLVKFSRLLLITWKENYLPKNGKKKQKY